MITLYQIKYTDEIIDFLNGPEGGWNAAEKKYPMVKAKMNCQFEGSEAWLPEYFEHYRAVANIKAETLEEGFGIGNAFGGAHMDMVEQGLLEPLLPYTTLHNGHVTVDMCSMSVGDICKFNGSYYMCDRFGWSEIEIND